MGIYKNEQICIQMMPRLHLNDSSTAVQAVHNTQPCPPDSSTRCPASGKMQTFQSTCANCTLFRQVPATCPVSGKLMPRWHSACNPLGSTEPSPGIERSACCCLPYPFRVVLLCEKRVQWARMLYVSVRNVS
eukprot:1155044-Pelagomonas_calceolata.AAC.2